MSGRLHGRVAIVTGAGRGLGRAHALKLAAEGASVVVNDLGVNIDGSGDALRPAEDTVQAIKLNGGQAVSSEHDISDWRDSERMIRTAIDTFGDLHILVNNAGILRDRSFANMSEVEWDDVIRVHLKGHAAPSRHAFGYWRERSKAGHEVKASIIHTSSIAGYVGNFGQANYAAAKLGVVALSRVLQMEGERYGIRSNAISPSARTRMMGGGDPPKDLAFDMRDPANVSPLVAWLATEDCPAKGQLFQVYGSRLLVLTLPQIAYDLLNADGSWTLEDLDREVPSRLVTHMSPDDLLADLRSRQGGSK